MSSSAVPPCRSGSYTSPMSWARAASSPSSARSGQQVVGQHRPRRIRPGRGGAQPGQRRRGRARGRLQVGDDRADHHRAGAEPPGELARGAQRVVGAAQHHHQPVAVHPGQQVEPGPPGDRRAARRSGLPARCRPRGRRSPPPASATSSAPRPRTAVPRPSRRGPASPRPGPPAGRPRRRGPPPSARRPGRRRTRSPGCSGAPPRAAPPRRPGRPARRPGPRPRR